ncbi:conserved hypothetical protein [Chloroherpeton thalassium ATCC 35110]|uniref:RsbT co-antagonist protein RsbRD N-terminal domain-containing protein n=1 Tax=Chloroherpeton thalassium (strain ATCC 35110 / GB-78) TaxID=517418 RepID=B3QUS7_CHLT3|nr:RsbRD N-terminal domain-containing protein [Chloroherpeton thalassium]ACF14428.1 conserved hypothetical protein [Chloroherpeton thalassium ATCC 35110]
MLYNRFIRVIEDHAESLTEQWIKEVRTNPSTPSYAKLSKEDLHDMVYDIYSKLGYWVKKEESSLKEIAEHFLLTGRKRAQEGYKLSEVVYANILARVVLWQYITDEGIVSEGIDLNRAFEFSQRLSYFFDKAIYFITVGFESTHIEEHKLREEGGFFDKVFDTFRIWLIRDIS